MNSNSGSTVRSYALNRLVNDMINAAVTAGKQVAPACDNYLLILDTYTSQIINSIAQPKDIFDTITGLESIEKKRKAYPKFQAIYYLEPTVANLELVRQDVAGKLYGPVHLFFSRYIPDSVMDELRRMPEVIARVATLKELNLDFIVVDDCQFTLDNKEGLMSKLYSNTPDYSALSTVGEKLFTMISVFLPTSDLEVYTLRKSVAEPVANQVMNKFKALASKNSNLVDPKAKKIKLVVLDRAFDPRTPAMHDLSYQPLVYDLCNLENNAAKILKENPKQGTKEVEVMKLDEKDTIWTDFRFKHIAQVSKEHPDKINEFTKNNSAAKFSKGEAGKDPGRNLEAMIRDYPQFVEVTSRLRLHQQLIEEATGKVELRGYRESAEVEVMVATGVNSNNETLSNSDIIDIVKKEMRNPKFKDEDRARLAIAVLCSMNLTQEQQNMVMNCCQDPKLHRAIQNMVYLGVRNELSSSAKVKVTEEEKKFFKDYAKTVKYLSGHYLPKLYFLLKNIEDGKVSETHYSVQRYPGTAPQKRLISMDLAANKTFNIGKEKIDNKDKLIVFFIGGASYSEIRTVRDTKMITGRDDLFGIVGGTTILSPAAYLAELSLIS